MLLDPDRELSTALLPRRPAGALVVVVVPAAAAAAAGGVRSCDGCQNVFRYINVGASCTTAEGLASTGAFSPPAAAAAASAASAASTVVAGGVGGLAAADEGLLLFMLSVARVIMRPPDAIPAGAGFVLRTNACCPGNPREQIATAATLAATGRG